MNLNPPYQFLRSEDAAASGKLNTVKTCSKKDHYVLYELLNVFTFAGLIVFFQERIRIIIWHQFKKFVKLS
jgi:hypothetical protein